MGGWGWGNQNLIGTEEVWRFCRFSKHGRYSLQFCTTGYFMAKFGWLAVSFKCPSPHIKASSSNSPPPPPPTSSPVVKKRKKRKKRCFLLHIRQHFNFLRIVFWILQMNERARKARNTVTLEIEQRKKRTEERTNIHKSKDNEQGEYVELPTVVSKTHLHSSQVLLT